MIAKLIDGKLYRLGQGVLTDFHTSKGYLEYADDAFEVQADGSDHLLYLTVADVDGVYRADTIALNAIEAEYVASQYSRDRAVEYAKLNQDELRFDDTVNGTTVWVDTIKAIKAKFPK